MEVSYNFEELKKFIERGEKIHYGESNSFVYYDELLIKFYPEMYQQFKKHKDIDEENIMRIFYDNNKNLTNPFVNFKQLNYLMDKASNITLSKLPQGILYFNKVPVGIIQPYFEKHKWLHYLEDISHKEMYYLTRNILLALRELEENGIYRLGINRNNIVYNGVKPELVDLCGSDLAYGENEELKQSVYCDYLDLLYSLIKRQSFDANLFREFKDILSITNCTYEECENVIKRLEKKI